MVEIPGSVDTLLVTAKHGLAIADSDDVGNQPDWMPSNATVNLSPVDLDKPYVVVGEPPEIVSVGIIVCKLVAGILYAPANGQAPVADETPSLPVEIISPLSAGLSDVGWKWQADFQPPIGAGWKAFSIVFNAATEENGVEVNLARAALLEVNTTASPQPMTWTVAGDGTNPPEIPAQAVQGQFVLDTTTWDLYQIGA